MTEIAEIKEVGKSGSLTLYSVTFVDGRQVSMFAADKKNARARVQKVCDRSRRVSP